MNKTAAWIVVLLMLGGLAAWFLLKRPAPEEHPSVVDLPPASAQQPAPRPNHPVEAIEAPAETSREPLPALADSDASVIEALADLAGPEALGRVLITEQVVARIVATVDRMDSRALAPLVMPVHPPQGAFRVQPGATDRISAANYERYQPYAALARAMPVEGAVAFYRRHYPLFQQAYEELGYEGAYFNDRLVAVIDHLLATPAPESPPAVARSESVYVYQDETLEALSAGQKVLIRIGPRHASIVREKLRAFRAAIAQGPA